MPRVKTFKLKDNKLYNEEQKELLLESLKQYFLNYKCHLEEILDIVENNETLIKLAMIDFFVTIYAKKHKCFIELPGYEYFYINDEYKNQLKSFTKTLFDPFKRNKKMEFSYDDITFTTTVGQLNFLKWALKHGIIKYMKEHYESINIGHKKHLENKKIKQEEKNKLKQLAKLETAV